MSLTNEQLDELEATAKAATPGPWLERHEDVYSEVDAHVAFCLTVCSSADECCITKKQAQANAAYIAAANPAVVLEMIAEIRKRDKTMHRLVRTLRNKNRALTIAQRECKHAQERAARHGG